MLQLKALSMRQRSMSYPDIATALNITTAKARSLVEKALATQKSEAVDSIVKLEGLKLDTLETVANQILTSRFVMIQGGRPVVRHVLDETGNAVLNEDGQPIVEEVVDVAPNLAAMDRILKIMERRSKLLGLDRPVKSENLTTIEAGQGVQVYLPGNGRE